MAGQEGESMAQVTGGDQFGTAAGNGSTGALAHDGGRQGDEETVGGGADLVDEGKVGSQSFRFLAQETYQETHHRSLSRTVGP